MCILKSRTLKYHSLICIFWEVICVHNNQVHSRPFLVSYEWFWQNSASYQTQQQHDALSSSRDHYISDSWCRMIGLVDSLRGLAGTNTWIIVMHTYHLILIKEHYCDISQSYIQHKLLVKYNDYAGILKYPLFSPLVDRQLVCVVSTWSMLQLILNL